MTIPPPTDSAVAVVAWLAIPPASLAAIVASVAFGRYALRTARYVEVLHTIVERELTTNGGSSMRDKLDAQCAALQLLTPLPAQLQHHIDTDDAVQAALLSGQAALRSDLDALRQELRSP